MINKFYIILGLVLYIIFGIATFSMDGEHIATFCAIFIPFAIFALIVNEVTRCKINLLNSTNLFIIVLLYSLFGVLGFYVFSQYMDNDYFLFSKRDALEYYNYSMNMKDMSYVEGIMYLSNYWNFDDWGAPIWITTVFKIYPSQIILGVANAILGALTAINIFAIAKKLMPKRYAFLAALTFTISSFMLTRNAQVSKEPIMVFVVILAFRLFYDYLSNKNIIYLFLAILAAALSLFFRVPVFLIIILCFAVTLILKFTKNIVVITIMGLVVVLLLVSTAYFDTTYESYLYGGDVERMIAKKNNASFGSGIINHITDPIAALIGPFPQAILELRIQGVLYTSGLLYRLILSGFFFIASYYIVIRRKENLYPLILFFFINALGLAISVKGLETRLALPHLPMMYIVAFWGITLVDWQKRIRKRDVIPKSLSFWYIVGIVGVCILWNLRGIM